MKRSLKPPKLKTIDITYWWHPFMYTLVGYTNSFYAPMKLSEKRTLLYRIDMNKKSFERYIMI